MKFKNFEDIEYELIFAIPKFSRAVEGLCDSPDTERPQIIVDPQLLKRRKLNVLIEEVFHAHLYELPEWKARKFAANLGKLIYSTFMAEPSRRCARRKPRKRRLNNRRSDLI